MQKVFSNQWISSLIVGITLLLLCSCGTHRSSQPERLQFDSTEVHVGVLSKSHGVYDFTLGFTNNCKRPVKILDLSTSCPCATVECPLEVVASGESSKLTIHLDPREMTLQDAFLREIYVVSDAPNDSITLSLEGTLIH